jgi:hypothetical protein
LPRRRLCGDKADRADGAAERDDGHDHGGAQAELAQRAQVLGVSGDPSEERLRDVFVELGSAGAQDLCNTL